MTPTTNRESDKFMLRLPEGMREQIKKTADENGRSMNAEIVERLSFALREDSESISELRNELKITKSELEREKTLRESANKNLDEITKLNGAYRILISDITTQITNIKYFILSYVDQIPFELSLWAYNFVNRSPDSIIKTREETKEEMTSHFKSYKERMLDEIQKEIKSIEDADRIKKDGSTS